MIPIPIAFLVPSTDSDALGFIVSHEAATGLPMNIITGGRNV